MKNVLIIEPDDAFRVKLASAVGKLDFQVISCAGSADDISVWINDEMFFDLLIIEGDVDGDAYCRFAEVFPGKPIILITRDESAKIGAEERGHVVFLLPLSMEVLTSKVRKLIV